MGIRPRQDWGESARPPPEAVPVRNDAEARAAVTDARRKSVALPELLLSGGDLHRTLGGRVSNSDRVSNDSEHLSRFDCDLGSALLDGRIQWFTAHLIARRGWLKGPLLLAFNAAFLGHWNLAPKGHPGDGLLEILEVSDSMGAGERLRALRRLRSGNHLPHPAIRTSRRGTFNCSFARPTAIWLDGEWAGEVRNLMIRLESDALSVYM